MINKMDIKEQLKDILIDQVADSLGLGLQKHGANLQGDCPTGHGSEHHKCFSLNLKGNYFSCFQCGVGGDVIDLVELAKGIEFIPAMKWLAEHYRPDLLPMLDNMLSHNIQFDLLLRPQNCSPHQNGSL